MGKKPWSFKQIILVLVVIGCVLFIPAALKAKSNFDKQMPPLVNLPETISVQGKGYFREGCAVPAYVDNCDSPTNCYTQDFITQDFSQTPIKLDSITYSFYKDVPVYSGPDELGRPSVYLAYSSGCLIRFLSSEMG